MSPVLSVEDLHTHFLDPGGVVRAVDGVTFRVDAGETVGVVGESGCGKTTLGLSLLGLVPHPGRIVAGRILLDGQDLAGLDEATLRRLRGDQVAMSFQDPMTALNPLARVGTQVAEAMTAQGRLHRAEAARRTVELLARTHIPAPAERARAYPHQLSGGMRQRVLLATGVANQPRLLVADEPTTALDVTTQAQIVELLADLNHELAMATVLITHDLGLVARLAHRVVVMYAGKIVEAGPVGQVLADPQHPYTWHLLRAIPRLDVSRSPRRPVGIAGAPPDLADPPSGCRFHPRCAFREERCASDEPPLEPVAAGQQAACWVRMANVAAGDRPTGDGGQRPGRRAVSSAAAGSEALLELDGVAKHFPAPGRGRAVRAVDGVSLTVSEGETVGLIGESGCGKTTLARLVAGLHTPTTGRVAYRGQDLARLRGRARRRLRRDIQLIFQDPFASLDPRMPVGRSVAEPLTNFRRASRAERRRRVAELFDLVGLNPDHAGRYPHEFSGGQRQRIGIARALAPEPSLLVCDEPLSSLDVSIQAEILELLADLQTRLGMAYLFVSHDLAVVHAIADRIAVMYLGQLVEVADADELITHPRHPYTKALLDAVTVPDPHATNQGPPAITGQVPSPADPPPGCRFHPRCPLARAPGVCRDQPPELRTHDRPHHLAACHFAEDVTTTALRAAE